MNAAPRTSRILVLIEQLRTAHSDALSCLEEMQALLVEKPTTAVPLAGGNVPAGRAESILVVDEQTCSIAWKRKACRLGPGICFRFFAFLARHPDRYFTYEQLLLFVWEDQTRTDSAIRTVVRDLRREFREAGLAELADAIRGRAHTYGLFLHSPA